MRTKFAKVTSDMESSRPNFLEAKSHGLRFGTRRIGSKSWVFKLPYSGGQNPFFTWYPVKLLWSPVTTSQSFSRAWLPILRKAYFLAPWEQSLLKVARNSRKSPSLRCNSEVIVSWNPNVTPLPEPNYILEVILSGLPCAYMQLWRPIGSNVTKFGGLFYKSSCMLKWNLEICR